MTKFNQAALAAVSSIALFGGAMTLITPAAKADYYNTNRVGNSTYTYGSGGQRMNTNSVGNTTYFNGRTSNGTSYRGQCTSIGNSTFCN